MTLQVSFEDFVETAKRLLKVEEAYVVAHAAGTLVTAAHAEHSVVVACVTPAKIDSAEGTLRDFGFTVYRGAWITPEEVTAHVAPNTETYVAAVAYRSADEKPGLWVDAFPLPPTPLTAVKAMYDEFLSTGELDDIPFEDFMKLANPNVVILSPPELRGYAEQKEC